MPQIISRENRERRQRLVAVAVDKDKYSQQALKWAVDNFITRGQTVRLVHVIQRPPLNPNPDDNSVGERQLDHQTMDLFLPLRCFCTRRQIQCEAVVLEDPDVAKALVEYVTQCGIETLLLGAVSKSGLSRLFKATDIPASILKWAPDFCNVYVISKGKVAAVRSATRLVPIIRGDGIILSRPQNLINEAPSVISLSRENDGLFYDEVAALDMNSSSGASTDSSFFSFYENLGSSLNPPHNVVDPYRRSSAGGTTLDSFRSSPKHPSNLSTLTDFSSILDYGTSSSTESTEDTNDETRRLRIELKQTMDMYHAACREALAAKQQVMKLQEWKRKEEKRIREGHVAEEEASSSSSSVKGKEKARYKAAIEAAEAAQKFVELEVQKRVEAEINRALSEAEERRRLLHALDQSHVVVKYQSLFHILAVVFLFYFYFSI